MSFVNGVTTSHNSPPTPSAPVQRFSAYHSPPGEYSELGCSTGPLEFSGSRQSTSLTPLSAAQVVNATRFSDTSEDQLVFAIKDPEEIELFNIESSTKENPRGLRFKRYASRRLAPPNFFFFSSSVLT